MPLIDLKKYYTALNVSNLISANGRVSKVVGLVIEARGPEVRLGSICDIYTKNDMPGIEAEVMGFRDNNVLLMPFGDLRGIGPGSR